jgi:hypothetical protein
MTIPTIMTPQGLQPISPETLRAVLVAGVAATNPGYTSDLPGSLIEDIASTDVGALTTIDQARVDLINSVSPLGANAFLLPQLGQIYGTAKGKGSNTSAYVIFTGTPGYTIDRGFTVSDGSHQYTVQDGAIIGTSGTTQPVYVLATVAGVWPVPATTIVNLVTSVPTGYGLTVTNPNAGTPGVLEGQTEEDYRAQVLQAGLATAQGVPSFLRKLLQSVSGVQARLISIRLIGGKFEIIVGGGDPYEVAGAIFNGVCDVGSLVGSTAHPGRNVTVSVIDYPDSYPIVFVVPASQVAGVTLNWNTSSPNFVSDQAVSQLATPALVSYINSIPVGQPMNIFELQNVFQTAISGIVSPVLISRMVFAVTINGVPTPVETGTGLVPSDAESYFAASSGTVVITRG